MSRKLTKSYYVVSIAMFAALSIVFDVFAEALPLRAPWGMQIDFVGTIWVLGYFLYGLSVALPVSVITALYIILFTPTALVGGAMKFLATIPMFLTLALVSYLPFLHAKGAKLFNRFLTIVALCILASAIRMVVATALNLYWAIPFYYGMAPEQALAYFGGLVPLVIFVAGFNLLQGIVDIFVPWFIAFKLKLSAMYGTW